LSIAPASLTGVAEEGFDLGGELGVVLDRNPWAGQGLSRARPGASDTILMK